MKKIVNFIKKIFMTLADCLAPTLTILIGVGMIKALLILLGPSALNILNETSPTYIVLSFVSDAGYYFMPIYVAVATAENFNTNKYIAALVGGMLLSPSFVEYVNAGKELSFLNLPIALTNYDNQVLPSLISVWLMSIIYNFLNEHIPENFKAILVPLITITVMIPITFCVIGPVGVLLADYTVELIMALMKLGAIGNAILCAILPLITIAGLSGANLSAMLILAATGVDPILFFSNVMYNVALGFTLFAICIKKKDPDKLAAGITSAVAGASEPALFGTVIKDSKALVASMAGDFVGGLVSGILGVKSYAMASFGIFGIIATIGENSSILNAVICIVLAALTSFVVSFILHKNND